MCVLNKIRATILHSSLRHNIDKHVHASALEVLPKFTHDSAQASSRSLEAIITCTSMKKVLRTLLMNSVGRQLPSDSGWQ